MSRTMAELGRRQMTDRQAEAIGRLVEAAVAELRETGYDGLTVRKVAHRAGVAPATAYTYFSSKNHLVAEVYWRRLAALPAIAADGRPPLARVVAALHDMALIVSDEPELAAACTMAILGADPDVRRLRVRIGLEVHTRITAALGSGDEAGGEPDRRIVSLLELAYSGAMVQAGMGFATYEQLAGQLADVAELAIGRYASI